MKSQPKPSRQEVVVMLLDGVARVGRGAKHLTDEQWSEPCCGNWTASDVARHLLNLTRDHHHWLDAAISGDTATPYDLSQTDTRNSDGVEFLSDLSGPEAVAEFVRTAGRYANRVADHWELPMGVPGGIITAGQQCALASLEFHLHAWDLAQMSGDTRYEPPRVRQLLTATGEAKAAQAGGVDAIKILSVTWARHRYQAWRYLLKASGRAPSRDSRLSELTTRFRNVVAGSLPNRLAKRQQGQTAPHDQQTTDQQTTDRPDSVIDLRGDAELPLSTADRASVTSD